jgi:hypothetical protein
MTIAHSDELRHSPAAHDTKLSSRVIVIVRSLNNILHITLQSEELYFTF